MDVEYLLNELEGLVHHLPHSVQGRLNEVIETVRHIYETTLIAITPHEPVHDGRNALASHYQKLQELHAELTNNAAAFQLVYQGEGATAYHNAASTSLGHLQTTLDHISFASQQHDTMSLQFGDARNSQLMLITMLSMVGITLGSLVVSAGTDAEIAVPAAAVEVAGAGEIIASVTAALEAAGGAITALEIDSVSLGMLAFTVGALLDRTQTIDVPSTTSEKPPKQTPPPKSGLNNLLQNLIKIFGPGISAIKIGEAIADEIKKQQLIDALRKAYPECEGIIDWEKFLEAHPDWTIQEMTDYLQALQDAQSIKDKLDSLANNPRYKKSIQGPKGWYRRIQTPLGNLIDMLYDNTAKPSQIMGAQNNIKGVWYELSLAMQFDQKGTLVDSGVKKPNGGNGIDVDLVLDEGRTWAEVKNQGSFTSGSNSWGKFSDMVKSRFEAAKMNGIDEFDFYLYNDKGGLTKDQIDLINEWSKKTGVKTKIVTNIKPGPIPSGTTWCKGSQIPQAPTTPPAQRKVPTPTSPSQQAPAVPPITPSGSPTPIPTT